MATIAALGHVQEADESTEAAAVEARFGSLERAFFGSYAGACRRVDEQFFQAGDPAAVDEACRQSPVGKLLPNALYVHRSALESLDPLLRIHEGCARAYLGEIDG